MSARRLGMVTSVAICATALAGCANPVSWVTGGGSTIDTYCSTISSDQARFAGMFASGSADVLLANLPMLRTLAAQAPADIADDWQNFLTPVEGLDRALRTAGVKPADYHDGLPPAGTSAADRELIAAAAGRLASPGAVAGAGAIEQEARDVCKLNLGM